MPVGGMSTVVSIGMQGKPATAEAYMMLQQPEACLVFSWGSCPWISGPWQWWAAQAPGAEGGMWIVTCACTQYPWWLQQLRLRFMPVCVVQAECCGSHPSLELV